MNGLRRRGMAIAMALGLVAGSLRAEERGMSKVVLAVHGGTGLAKSEITPELEREYRAGLKKALEAGYTALRKEGATSLDAVEAAIRVLEDAPAFNAGKGAVFTHDGRNELDASIMEGKTKQAGAVAGVTTVKNPISAARAVMEKSPHVLMVGRGAEQFATQQGLEIVDPAYFRTEFRWQQLQKRLQEEQANPTKAAPPVKKDASAKQGAVAPPFPPGRELGTVGAVALDAAGNLAAGTSTGGMTNKQYGRVGDSPIIGAGTYADNTACAVSATGHGEYFIRYAVAHTIVSLMKYKEWSVQQAADDVVLKTLKDAGGEGGVIALDAKGNLAFSYNSEGLYRGYVTADGKVHVLLYEE